MDNHGSVSKPTRDCPPSSLPACLPSVDVLRRRRLVVLALNVATYLALAGWMAAVAGAGGWSSVDAMLFACFLVVAPWTVLGFWNALIGLWLLHGRPDGLERVAPFILSSRGDEPLRLKTAVLMTLRNECPTRAFLRLKTVKRSLDETGDGASFGYFILSDCPIPASPQPRKPRSKPGGGRPRTLSASPIVDARSISATKPAMCAISASAGAGITI